MRQFLKILDFSYGVHGQSFAVFGVDLDLLDGDEGFRIRTEVAQVDYRICPFTKLLVCS